MGLVDVIARAGANKAYSLMKVVMHHTQFGEELIAIKASARIAKTNPLSVPKGSNILEKLGDSIFEGNMSSTPKISSLLEEPDFVGGLGQYTSNFEASFNTIRRTNGTEI